MPPCAWPRWPSLTRCGPPGRRRWQSPTPACPASGCSRWISAWSTPRRAPSSCPSGIRIDHRTYDRPCLNAHRGRPSPTASRGGKWEIHTHPHDLRQVRIRLPDPDHLPRNPHPRRRPHPHPPTRPQPQRPIPLPPTPRRPTGVTSPHPPPTTPSGPASITADTPSTPAPQEHDETTAHNPLHPEHLHTPRNPNSQTLPVSTHPTPHTPGERTNAHPSPRTPAHSQHSRDRKDLISGTS